MISRRIKGDWWWDSGPIETEFAALIRGLSGEPGEGVINRTRN